MSNYWVERQDRANKARADKTIEDIEKQLKKYYSSAMKRTIADFEATYNKMLEAVADGKDPTPADLYKLDQYWQMQAQLRNEMQKLGDKEIALMSKEFEAEWVDIYKGIHLPSDSAFSTISVDNAKQMINSSWLADGKTFSQRIWGNTERLVETLNEQLIHCVVTGKKPTELRELLQERFNVSYNRADTLVRTEVAHIETAAAAQRYKDYGLEKYEYLGRDEHDIGCDCKRLNGKQFLYSEMVIGKNAPPLHPNCRCAIIPVIDDEIIMEDNDMIDNREDRLKAIEKNYPYVLAAEKDRLTTRWVDKLQNVQAALRRADDKELAEQEAWLKQKIESNYKLAEEYILNSFVFCMDCGKPIPVDGKKTNAVKRCPECQAEYRKKYKAEKEKERRKKRKKN